MLVRELIQSVRYRVRDTDATNFTDEEIITYLGELLNGCYSTLQNIESILVIGDEQLDIQKDVSCYALDFEHNGFLDDGVWIDGNIRYLRRTTLPQVGPFLDSPATGVPSWYYLDQTGQLCLYPTPSQDGTLKITYWLPFEAPTNAEQEIPWGEYWGKYLIKAVVIECLERQERDISQQSIAVVGLFEEALGQLTKLGTRQRILTSNMFTVPGV